MRIRRTCFALLAAAFCCLPFSGMAQELDREDVALEYMRNSQWDFANHEWRKLIEEDPRNINAHVGLARSLTQAGFLREAVWHLETVRSEISHPDLEVELAQACMAQGWPDKALTHLLGVIKQHPYHLAAFQGLMEVREHLSEEKRRQLEPHLKARARDAEGRGRRLMAAGQYQRALPYFQLAVSYERKAGLWNDYALALLLSGRSQQSLGQFRELEKVARQWQHHANAALAYLSLDQTVAARREIEKAIALTGSNRDKARLYNILGYIYENAGKTSSARYAYEKAVELDSGLLKARLNLAYIFQQAYQFKEAVAIYESILAGDPHNAMIWNRLGFVYELMHEPKKARGAYEKAIAAEPGMKEAYTNLAMLYKKMDEQEKSDAMLKKVMELQFAKIETGQPRRASKPQPAERQSAGGHPLFQFVDVFMADVAS